MSSLSRKIGTDGTISLQRALDCTEKYGLLAVPNAIRLKKYVIGDSVHMILDVSSGRIRLPHSVRDITGFTPGTVVRYYQNSSFIIVYSPEYSGDGSEFDGLNAERLDK